MKRTVKDLVGIKGKTILLRVDFNVPIDENGMISDTTRIDRAIPTIQYLSKQKAKIVVLSHLGRPKGYDIHKSLWPTALYLKSKLKCSVSFCHGLVDNEAKARVEMLRDGDVLVMENTRFFEGETSNDMAFAKKLAALGDIYVNDAFGAAHRANASTHALARILPNAIGLLMEKEISALGSSLLNPKRPFVAVIGGAKVSSKLSVLKNMMEKADTLIIGGAMAYTFLKAKGENVGESLVENDMVEQAYQILQVAKELGKKILLPIDHICIDNANKRKGPIKTKELRGTLVGCDIGEATMELYAKAIYSAKQIFWNGPMGMFEKEEFALGTYNIGLAIASARGYSVVGGGDTVAAVNKLKITKGINFISTGGGATMEFIEQGTLPCIEVIQEKIV